MPKPLTIRCDVSEDGALPRSRSEQVKRYLRFFAGGEVEITVRKPKRSTAANNYYWSCIALIQRGMIEAGMMATTDAIHYEMKRRYLPARASETVFGEPVTLEPSTANLDSTEFFDYVESVRYDEDVLALGVDIPDPDPSYRSYRITEPPSHLRLVA